MAQVAPTASTLVTRLLGTVGSSCPRVPGPVGTAMAPTHSWWIAASPPSRAHGVHHRHQCTSASTSPPPPAPSPGASAASLSLTACTPEALLPFLAAATACMHDRGVQAEALRSLCGQLPQGALSQEEALQRCRAAAGAVDWVLSTLHTHGTGSDDAPLAADALLVLQRVAWAAEDKLALRYVVQHVVGAVQRHGGGTGTGRGSGAVAQHGLACLANLAVDEENKVGGGDRYGMAWEVDGVGGGRHGVVRAGRATEVW